MKILLMSERPVVPAIGGIPARVLALTRAIRSLGHELHLVYLDGGRAFDLSVHEAEFGSGRVHRVVPRGMLLRLRKMVRGRAARLYRRWMRLVGSPRAAYNHLDEWLAPGFAAPLRTLQTQYCFECVIADHVWLSRLLKAFPADVLKILDSHDVFADRHLAMRATGQRYGFYTISPGAETRGLKRADVVFAITQTDAEIFRERLRGTPPVFIVSHFVPIGEPVAAGRGMAGAFVGSASAGNTDTVRLLIEQILPRVRVRLPDFRLLVAGSVSLKAPDAEGVIKLGTVPDLRAVYLQAPLLLCPTRVGTGIAIKSLEALGMGVPVIATRTAARGLPATAGGLEIVPDGDVESFADAVVRLAVDPAVWAGMSADALRTARAWNEAQLVQLGRALASR